MAAPVLNSPVLGDCEVKSFSTVMLKDFFVRHGLAPSSSDGFARPGEHDYLLDSGPEDGNCLKGFFVAIGLEAGAVIGVYSIWLFWHILH